MTASKVSLVTQPSLGQNKEPMLLSLIWWRDVGWGEIFPDGKAKRMVTGDISSLILIFSLIHSPFTQKVY